MLEGLKHAHSGLRWLVLVALVLAIANAYSGWKKGKEYTSKDRKKHLFALIFTHTQLLLGFALFGLNWGGKVNFGNMGNAMTRFYTVEHTTMMLLAIVAITIGFSKAKRTTDSTAKFKTVCIMYGVGLFLILAAIPWPFRTVLGAGWF